LDDAQRTALELARRGHEALVAPLSEIRLLDNRQPELRDVQAVLATSSNGIRAFVSRCRRRDIPVFAVGAMTAATAQSEGFARVASAEGDSAALARMICDALSPAAGVLLHICGRRRTSTLHRQLEEAGFAFRVWELYDMVCNCPLPEQVVADFRRGAVDAVLVLSPESGRDFVQALRIAGIEASCGPVLACCISRAAAGALGDIEFGAIRTAATPTLEAVLALLDSGPARRHRTGFPRCERA
jgi:uroporphyrinogen-III synthase